MGKGRLFVLFAILFVIPNILASTIDQFHEVNEGEHLTFTERQDSWGVTWSYITTDSQPPTPTFMGIPPGVDNLGVPSGANMHKVFGYLKTDNYSSNGTNLGCILNCNITSTFDWTPDFCQAIRMNYTFYNTTSNTTRKYNYHFNLLKWRSDLPFPGVPIDTIIEKIRVNNVNRVPQISGVPSYINIPTNSPVNVYFNVSDPDELCNPSEENASAIVNFTSSPKGIGQLGQNEGQYYWYWTPNENDTGNYTVNVTATDSHGDTTLVQMSVNVVLEGNLIFGEMQTVPETMPIFKKSFGNENIPQSSTPSLITAYEPMSTIDRFHEVSEGQNLAFTEKQDSWGVTWSYITTDSQPPTPTFRGIPPGEDNLGLPAGATMPTVFGYLKTDNYSSNGTNLGCILNCNITAKFNWTPGYCQAIQSNYTFYNTTSNTTRKYNYHFNLLKWRSDLPFPGVPIDTIIEKIVVYNVNRAPTLNGIPSYIPVRPYNGFYAPINFQFVAYDADEAECGDDVAKPVIFYANGTNATINHIGNSSTYTFNWDPTSAPRGRYYFNFSTSDNYNVTVQRQMIVDVFPPKPFVKYLPSDDVSSTDTLK